MKIDSEGSEKKVIKGVRHFLRRVNIPYNAIETMVLKMFNAANHSNNEVKDSLKLTTNLGFVARDYGGWPNGILSHENYVQRPDDITWHRKDICKLLGLVFTKR